MTPEQFKQWMDKEIEWNIHLNEYSPHGDSIFAARRDLLKEVKEKYLSILPPVTVNY